MHSQKLLVWFKLKEAEEAALLANKSDTNVFHQGNPVQILRDCGLLECFGETDLYSTRLLNSETSEAYGSTQTGVAFTADTQ